MTEADQASSRRLPDLPAEVLLHIFQYLEVKFISEVLANVCTLFREIARDESTWRIRIQRRWPGRQYPAIPPVTPFPWTQACIEREEEVRMWSKEGRGMKTYTNSTAHYSSVDAVHVMRDVVVSGSRDRSINLWPCTASSEEGRPIAKYPDVHKGWVWTMCSQENLLISGAWDNTIKFWQVCPDGMTESRPEVKLKTAVLTNDVFENRVAAGTFDKKVFQLDVREDCRRIVFNKYHTKPVLAVKITPRHILSLSEDKTLVVHDRVAGKKLKKVNITGDSFPMSMALLDNILYVGDRSGNLHLIDTTADAFNIVQSYTTGSSGRVTSIHSGYGSLMTGSSDGTIAIFHPDRRLDRIALLKNPECGEIAQISYRHHTLAAACSSNTIKIWSQAFSSSHLF